MKLVGSVETGFHWMVCAEEEDDQVVLLFGDVTWMALAMAARASRATGLSANIMVSGENVNVICTDAVARRSCRW